MENVVEHVIVTMRGQLGEPLTVDDLARTARFSKFHFTRIFQRVTGVSPARFLSAMRLHEAKALLVNTSLNVADISYRVGYTSVGTFTTRFTTSVGVSPTSYRRLGGFAAAIETEGQDPSRGTTTMTGVVSRRGDRDTGPVFLGLFPNRVPEGRPAACALVEGPRSYRLEGVPTGRWFLLAVSATSSADSTSPVAPPLVGAYGPFEAQAGVPIMRADISLEPLRATDPPVLLALVDVGKAPATVATQMAQQLTARSA